MNSLLSRIISSSSLEFSLSGKRHRELKREVERLRELRLIAGKTQADVASALQIKQPSVSKMEKQTDMYLSTLRAYVEAIGGDLELVVRFPDRPLLRRYRLGDALGRMSRSPRQNTPRRRRPTAASQRLQTPIRDRNRQRK
jgi:transcriptional regulator with XRE-family HTH domain